MFQRQKPSSAASARAALREARLSLENATAARDHRSAIYWADVCARLADPATVKPLGSRE